MLVSSFPNRKLNLRFGFFYANLQQPLSQPSADSIPTPFVPSGHFPLIGGIGPWKGSQGLCAPSKPSPMRGRWHGEAVTDEVPSRSGVTPPSPPQRAISHPGASAFFVSAGDSFAPRRELLLSAVTKVAKSTGRNYVSALPQRATVGCDFPHLLAGIAFHHRCRSKGLRVRSPARRLTRPLASATAEIFRSCRRTPKPSPCGVRGVE